MLSALAIGGFLIYYNAYHSLSKNEGAFDKKVNFAVIVFTMDGCGAPCSDIVTDPKNKNIAFSGLLKSSVMVQFRQQPKLKRR